MPLDNRRIGRIAELGDIDDLERGCRHQIAHQSVADGAAQHADNIDRHPKEHTDGTATGSAPFGAFDLQPGQNE